MRVLCWTVGTGKHKRYSSDIKIVAQEMASAARDEMRGVELHDGLMMTMW